VAHEADRDDCQHAGSPQSAHAIAAAAQGAHHLTRTVLAKFPRISRDLEKRIEKYAKSQGLSYADALNQLVEHGLMAEANQRPTSSPT
jgi:hypothetical protein